MNHMITLEPLESIFFGIHFTSYFIHLGHLEGLLMIAKGTFNPLILIMIKLLYTKSKVNFCILASYIYPGFFQFRCNNDDKNCFKETSFTSSTLRLVFSLYFLHSKEKNKIRDLSIGLRQIEYVLEINTTFRYEKPPFQFI